MPITRPNGDRYLPFLVRAVVASSDGHEIHEILARIDVMKALTCEVERNLQTRTKDGALVQAKGSAR
jgi:hypothetical protein